MIKYLHVKALECLQSVIFTEKKKEKKSGIEINLISQF